MKEILAFSLFILVSTLTFAQQNYQDVVYLKNGSIIHGIIIEQIPNKSIKVETADKNVFFYQMAEIEKLTKEPMQVRSNIKNDSKGFHIGYQGIFEMGYVKGFGDQSMDYLKLSIINGYRFNPHFSLGLGTGLRYYLDVKDLLIPLFADCRINLLKNNNSPYFGLGVGYSFNPNSNFDAVGLLVSPSFGLNIKISDIHSLNIGVGYEFQKRKSYTFDYYYTSNKNSGCISINVGVSF
ncbi:MAG TPA: hypothetical protein VIK55_15535 [Paludibacter sp.]